MTREQQEMLDASRRALAKLEAMSLEDRWKRMQQIGIVAQDGSLAEPYRSPRGSSGEVRK